MKLRLSLFIIVLFVITSIVAVSSAQRDNEKPITGDFKITIKQTVGGQTTQNTTMIKGLRQREESSMSVAGMNMNQVNITQCDLRRTIQVNDSARKYLVTPMDADDSDTSAPTAPATTAGPTQTGGVVTMTVNTVDTGERKDMFGFTARHLKRTTTMESGPNSCQQQKMKFETDGWYINLEYGLSCESGRPPQAGRRAPQGCRDRYQYHHTGPAHLGFPLVETTTMYGADGSRTFTMTKEVTELSRANLDAALFDVPAGYTQASNQQELSGAPSMADIMAMAQKQSGQQPSGNQTSTPNTPANTSAPAVAKAKVGVVEINNKTKTSVSTDELRERLVATLNGNGIEAVALNASSADEAAMEAKAKGCTYILYTDISALKAASTGKKIGGFLKSAGVGGGSGDAGKSEARLDYRLVSVEGGAARLQASASSKEDSTDASVNAALQDEAKAVTSAVGGN